MNLTIIAMSAWVAAVAGEPDSVDSHERREPRIAVDFMASPFQFSGDLGIEWLYWPRAGLGAWASASGGYGKNWLAGQSNDYTIFQAGLTWHPSGRLRSNALYARYCAIESEQEVPDEDERLHRLRYESRQVRVGILGRDHLWKRLGWFWNAGLGFKAGDSRTWWVDEVPESVEAMAKWVRLVGYLDLGFGIALEI